MLKQEGLTKQIIEALGFDSKYSTPIDTPAKSAALGRDIDGKVASGSINYASVVGILLYHGHSHPQISYATHQCAQYNHSPKQSYKDALTQIGCYLKGTLTKGLILNQARLSTLIATRMRTLLDCGQGTTSTILIVYAVEPAT
jgi:hypothetical protein